jgi:hypothetical protein
LWTDLLQTLQDLLQTHRSSCNTRGDGTISVASSIHSTTSSVTTATFFAASDHPSIHLLLSEALSNLPPLLKKSTYGACEGKISLYNQPKNAGSVINVQHNKIQLKLIME